MHTSDIKLKSRSEFWKCSQLLRVAKIGFLKKSYAFMKTNCSAWLRWSHTNFLSVYDREKKGRLRFYSNNFVVPRAFNVRRALDGPVSVVVITRPLIFKAEIYRTLQVWNFWKDQLSTALNPEKCSTISPSRGIRRRYGWEQALTSFRYDEGLRAIR